MRWQPMNTAPKKHGAEVIGWFRKVKLDDDDNLTDEVVGGAMAQISRNGDGWTEPDWLDASGAYFFDDFSFEPEPVLWHPLPPEPTADELAHVSGVPLADGETFRGDSPMGESNGEPGRG